MYWKTKIPISCVQSLDYYVNSAFLVILVCILLELLCMKEEVILKKWFRIAPIF